MEERSFRTDFGYPCRYTPTIQDGPVFRWGIDFEISASRNGVMVSGDSWCFKAVGLQRLKGVLDVAMLVHEQLAENDRREVIKFQIGEEPMGKHKWLEKVSA